MKKLALLLAVAFSVSMFSCTGNEEKKDEKAAEKPATEEAAPAAEATPAEEVAPAAEATEAAPAAEEVAPAAEAAPAETPAK